LAISTELHDWKFRATSTHQDVKKIAMTVPVSASIPNQ
jgi:hypothetical protein